MGRIAKGYTEEQFTTMAEFFSKQTLQVSAQEADEAKAKAGAKLHEEYCEKCHEEGGKKDEDGSSILAGQWMPYLQFSFEDFENGNRESPKKMKKKVDDMLKEHGKESVEQVIHFYASQK
jgi:sulfide dehydrogenase cytochrome subunit